MARLQDLPNTLRALPTSNRSPMQNDSDWLREQVRNWATASLAELLQGLGTPVAGDDPDLHVLVPHHPRLHRAVVRTHDGRVRTIGLAGPSFAVPVPVVQAWSRECRRTFNTYDDVDDEQFFFYPALPGLPFVAVESWVPPAQQRAEAAEVLLSELTFHCAAGPDEAPFHFRDGWHLAPRPTRAAPTPPGRGVAAALKRWFRRS
jgi:hypothetical protein